MWQAVCTCMCVLWVHVCMLCVHMRVHACIITCNLNFQPPTPIGLALTTLPIQSQAVQNCGLILGSRQRHVLFLTPDCVLCPNRRCEAGEKDTTVPVLTTPGRPGPGGQRSAQERHRLSVLELTACGSVDFLKNKNIPCIYLHLPH